MNGTPTGMDPDSLVAIDVHVHVHQDLDGHLTMDDESLEAASTYFEAANPDPTVPESSEQYRQRRMAAVVFTVYPLCSPQRARAAGTMLRHKVLFGSDFPLSTPERWIRDFERLEIRDEVRPLIMKENAVTALGLRHA